MKPPRTIKIGPHRYTVRVDKARIDHHAHEIGDPLAGACEHDELEIAVDPNLVPSKQREIVLHESLHGMIATSGLGILIGHKREERACRLLAPLLLQVIRDNPALIRYLQQTE